jgi:alkanesulfonate monooxygenase SsuD/methylene tetrahydromethanopterin reductase-like flavin-dependent oxidoreductase (luciferase family)
MTIRLDSRSQLLLRHRRRRLFPTVIAQAREAEAAGFDSVFLMDHFYQLPMLGTPDQPMLEAYTALGRWPRPPNGSAGHAGHRQHLPQPDAVDEGHHHPGRGQRGRAILGIGTGWFELEHEQLGFEFGTFTDRFDKLEEALQIILPMIAGERVTVDGTYYRTKDAFANPRLRDHIPLMIGGSGEEDLRAGGPPLRPPQHHRGLPRAAGKLAALAQRCEEVDRDPATLETSVLVSVVAGEGVTEDVIPPAMAGRMVAGTAEQVAERLKTRCSTPASTA